MSDSVEPYVAWKAWHGDSFGKFNAQQAVYFAAETGLPVKAGVRVLEIGYGNGEFLGWARSADIEVFGVEISATLVDRALGFLGTERAFLGLEAPGLAPLSGTFSLIVAFDVIEHIAFCDLPAIFATIANLLVPGGRCIVRFPNGDSPFGRINQHGDPTHLTTLGGEKLRYLANQAGLRVEVIRAPALPASGLGLSTAVNRRLIALGRHIVERTVSLLYFGGRRIPLDPNYTAVLLKPTAATQPIRPGYDRAQ